MFLFTTYLKVWAANMSINLIGTRSFEQTDFSSINMAKHGWDQSPRPYSVRRPWLCCGGVLCYRTQIQTCQTGELTSCSPLVRATGMSKMLVGTLSVPSDLIEDYCTDQTKIGEDQSPHLYNFRRPCQQRKGKLYVAYIGCLYGRFMVQSWPGNAYLFPKKEKKNWATHCESVWTNSSLLNEAKPFFNF